jgi:hypothetical protein
MAQRVTVTLEDDLDGGPADEGARDASRESGMNNLTRKSAIDLHDARLRTAPAGLPRSP